MPLTLSDDNSFSPCWFQVAAEDKFVCSALPAHSVEMTAIRRRVDEVLDIGGDLFKLFASEIALKYTFLDTSSPSG